jgi:hypothetical protein
VPALPTCRWMGVAGSAWVRVPGVWTADGHHQRDGLRLLQVAAAEGVSGDLFDRCE